MATIQEALIAAQAQKSPFLSLLEGAAGGFATAQDKALENAKTLMALEEHRQQQIRQAEMEKQIKSQMELQTQQSLKSVGGAPTVLPSQKLQVEISQDEKGNYSRKFKVADPKADSYTAREYFDETSKKTRIGKFNSATGELIRSPEDAIAPASSQGLSPSLQYQMLKDAESKDLKNKSKVIPGYTPTGEVEIDEVEARKLRSGVAEFESFLEGLKTYRGFIEKYGTQEITDRNIAGQMDAYAKNLQLKVKNLAQLGVLSISDIPFIEKQIPEPGIFKTGSGMLGALTAAEKVARTSNEKQMKVSGYKKAQSSTVPDASGTTQKIGRFEVTVEP